MPLLAVGAVHRAEDIRVQEDIAEAEAVGTEEEEGEGIAND